MNPQFQKVQKYASIPALDTISQLDQQMQFDKSLYLKFPMLLPQYQWRITVGWGSIVVNGERLFS